MSKKLEREPISTAGLIICSCNADERQFRVALCLSLIGLGVCIAASVAQLMLVGCYVLTIRKHCEAAAVVAIPEMEAYTPTRSDHDWGTVTDKTRPLDQSVIKADANNRKCDRTHIGNHNPPSETVKIGEHPGLGNGSDLDSSERPESDVSTTCGSNGGHTRSEGEKCGNDARSHLKIVHIN